MIGGNNKSEPIIPWAFVVTIEASGRVDPNDLLEAMDIMANDRPEILSIQVEALGSIKVTGVQRN